MMALRNPEEIKVHGRSLREVLKNHSLWLESGAQRGQRAGLGGQDLRAADLRGLDLRRANLAGADLSDADLSGVQLQGAVLNHAIFRNALLSGADLRDDFSAEVIDKQGKLPFSPAVTEMSSVDLGGADLTLAVLPERLDRKPHLERCRRRARRAQGAVAVLTVALAGALVFLATVRDYHLLLDSGWINLPLLDRPITRNQVFNVLALALTLGYLVLHGRYLEKLWRSLKPLPAILPDGTELPGMTDLWPANILAQEKTRTDRAPLARWDGLAYRALGLWLWGATPLILAVLWWRYLPGHDWVGVIVTGGAASACLGLAIPFRLSARRTFEISSAREPRASGTLWGVVAFLLCAAVMFGVSYGAIEGPLGQWLPVAARIEFHDLSQRPREWRQLRLDQVEGASFPGANLRHAKISYSFLARADFRGAQLRGAAITASDLRGANLSQAGLTQGSLFDSNLEGALLTGTDLRGASLLCAANLTDAQLLTARTDRATILPSGLSGPFLAGTGATLVDPERCASWDPSQPRPLWSPTRRPRSPLETQDLDLRPIPDLGGPSSGSAAGGEAGAEPDPAAADSSVLDEEEAAAMSSPTGEPHAEANPETTLQE